MSKRPKSSPEPIATLHPLERLQAAQNKLMEIESSIADVVRDVEAANISLLAGGALRRLEEDSMLEPIAASEQIDRVIDALTQVESQARGAASSARESAKLAEHLLYAVRSLYREVLARGDRERSRLRDEAAARQKSLFPAEERN